MPPTFLYRPGWASHREAQQTIEHNEQRDDSWYDVVDKKEAEVPRCTPKMGIELPFLALLNATATMLSEAAGHPVFAAAESPTRVA